QGFKINLSGAFAAYFALVLIVITTHSVWDPAPNYQVWTVDGKVTERGRAVPLLESKDITISPRNPAFYGAGGFTLQLTAMVVAGNRVFPKLTISHDGFQEQGIELDPATGKELERDLHMRWDEKTRQIRISNIVLQPLPAYDENAHKPLEQAAIVGGK